MDPVVYLPQLFIVLYLPLELLSESVNLVLESGPMLLVIVWSQPGFPRMLLRWVFRT